MAADWIKVEKTTSRKPEVLRIAELLHIHPDHAFGLCVRFWFWCDDQLSSGNAPSVTNVTLDCVVGRDGFADALLNVGWLRVRNGSLEVPNFERHLSQSAKSRALAAGRADAHRSKNRNARSVTKALPELERDKSKNKKEEKTKDTGVPPVSVLEPAKKFNPASVPIPESLNSEAFRDAWVRWCKHRSEIRQPLKPTMCDGQLRELLAMGHDRAIAALNHTIAKGWTGLREPDISPPTVQQAKQDDRQAERERRQKLLIERLGGGGNDAG